jgi:hypothetical protein
MNAPDEPLTIETLQACLADWFAPWVQDLGLRVESFQTDEVTLRCRGTTSWRASAAWSAARP